MDCAGCNTLKCASDITNQKLGAANEEQAMMWLKEHKMMYGLVGCKQGHAVTECVKKDGKWNCPNRKCRRVYPAEGPFLGRNAKLRAKEVVGTIYGWVSAETRKQIYRENQIAPSTATRLTKLIEEMVAYAHMERFRESAGTWTAMQKDETAISAIKKGGSGNGKRCREEGSQWVHGLVEVNRGNEAVAVFFLPVKDRTAESLNVHVRALAAGPRTRVWTDGARSNWELGAEFAWDCCNHKHEWVGPTGVHTQTIESMNNLLKRENRLRGSCWGRDDVCRGQRVMAYAELANSKLAIRNEDPMQRVCQDIRMWCEHVEMGEEPVDAQTDA